MNRPFLKSHRELNVPLQDKRNFGMLQQFDSLIIFGSDNGKMKSGFFVDADFNKMAPAIVKAFSDHPDLRELFDKCIKETQKLIIV
jgi:hypothetical protein